MKKIILTLVVAGCAALISQQAYAVTGSIEFTGAMAGSTTKGTTTITFTNPWHVFVGDGDYAGVPSTSNGGPATAATFNSFSYTGNGLTATLVAPVTPQWTFTYLGVTYSFDLSSLTNAVLTATGFTAQGNGTANIGTDSSPATWTIQGSGTKFTFTFSSSTTTAVPDGGSAVALLGIALTGIEAGRRLIRARKA